MGEPNEGEDDGEGGEGSESSAEATAAAAAAAGTVDAAMAAAVGRRDQSSKDGSSPWPRAVGLSAAVLTDKSDVVPAQPTGDRRKNRTAGGLVSYCCKHST